MARKKDVRAEALEILKSIQLTLELTGDLRADTVTEMKTALASTTRRVRVAKASAVKGEGPKRRKS